MTIESASQRRGLTALTLLGAALVWGNLFAQRVAADESTKDGATSTSLPEGWTTGAPRAELRPEFEHRATGGWKDGPRWIVRTDGREGQVGWWETTLPVEGGQAYRFEVRRRVEALTTPRQ